MDKLVRRRVRASSVLEVIIAMVVIVAVLGVSAMIYVNISRSSSLFRRLEVSLLLDSLSRVTIEGNTFFDERISCEQRYFIDKKVSPYGQSDKLVRVEWMVYDKEEHLIGERKELLLTRYEE